MANDEDEIYKEEDLVFYRDENGDVHSCGFNINSILLKKSLENNSKFVDLAVPVGIFYQEINNKSSEKDEEDAKEIEDDLYDRLLEFSVNKKQTRKKRGSSKKNTKKNISI